MTGQDEHEELVDSKWVATRLNVARPSVTRLMREMGVPRYEFTPKCVRYPKNAVEKAIASSFRPNTNENE